MSRLRHYRGVIPVLAAAGLTAVVYRTGLDDTGDRPPGSADSIETAPADAVALEARAGRYAAKAMIARGVAAGHVSVPAAAAAFRELNLLPPALPTVPGQERAFGLAFPDASEEDRLCLQVLIWVRDVVRADDPAREGEVVARVLAEFLAAGGGRGRIRLPDAAPVPLLPTAMPIS